MFGLFGKNIVGLDLGSSSIKAVQLKQTGGKWHLSALGTADIPGDAQESKNPEIQRAAILETLKRVFKENKIKVKRVVTSLSGDAVITRYVKLPYSTPDELRANLGREAEQYIPLNIDQVILDFQILGETQEEGQRKMDVLLIAAKVDVVEQHLALLKSAGLTPEVIDVDTFALGNAYEVNRLESGEETIALINIGATLTTINILEGGVSRFSRDIPVAGNDFTREIQKEFNIKFPEAEELKKTHGSISMEEDDFNLSSVSHKDDRVLRMSDVMTPVLNKLLGEIRRSFDYYETQARKKTVERVVLLGGSARLKNVNRFLANKLGIPVEHFAAFRNIEVEKGVDAELLGEKEFQLGVSLGLALRKAES
ncbi:MAG: type IV pilus assembly protein PilM [bacterium]